ncbi:MAG: hypothetical protein Q7S10_01445 [bacterium]|nr:hypothetical protein [bacterium]
MDEFNKLYEFVNLAEKNRKYPANTAHGKRAALKLFDTVVTMDERDSLELIEERMGEIYLNLISKHKDSFSIKSLNTYKGRLLKVIQDYKRYGKKPEAIAQWEAKHRKYTVRNIKDEPKDTSLHNLSFTLHKGVHKFQIALESGQVCDIEVPPEITAKDATRIKNIIEGLVK